MRTEFLCIFILTVAPGLRVKLTSCKNALTPTPTPHGGLLTVLRLWSRCKSYSLLLCGLFYVILFSWFSVLLALRLPRLGKRKLILVIFVRLFDLCLFGFVGFLFLLVSGKGCGL